MFALARKSNSYKFPVPIINGFFNKQKVSR